MTDTYQKYQQQLLQEAQSKFHETPISKATEDAFVAVPRHLFVNRYRKFGTGQWNDVKPETLPEQLGHLYADDALCLVGDDNDPISSISQPSFVLRSLDMLELRPGQKVFELGTASGWNAALMAHLVGPSGYVHSVELVPELAAGATQTLKNLGIANITVIQADGGDGYAPGAPYDRATFTAGTFDLPRHFYKQMTEGGLLLVGIKSEGGGDSLFLLRKVGNHFESLESMPCGWVQMRGKYQLDSADPRPVEELPQWNELQNHEISRTPYWWGTKGRDPFIWFTSGIRSFLGITEPAFRAFKIAKEAGQPRDERYFGLWDEQSRSLVLAKHDCLIAYGNTVAKDRLMHKLREWVDLGMPTGSSFTLHVYPVDVPIEAGRNQWIVKRRESQFLWMLPSSQ